MDKRTLLKKKIEFRETTLDELYAAYTALVKGGVKSYTIDDRALTRFDIPALKQQIKEMEEEIAGLEDQLNGIAARKVVGVIPRDW